jgi:hypothetical protein
MPKISQLSPAPLALDGTELVVIVQDGITVQTTTQAIADLAAAAASVISVNGQSGIVVLVPADIGAASAADLTADIAAHDAAAAAHGGVEALFGAHEGAGGISKHPLATVTDAGFAPPITGNTTDYLAGDGNYYPFPSNDSTVAVERIDSTDSPYGPNTDDQVILVDATAAVVVNLPEITALNDGLLLNIKIVAGAAGVTINAYNVADGTDTIDGANSLAIAALYASTTIVASYDSLGNSFWSIL